MYKIAGMETLETAAAVVEELGGPTKAAALVGRKVQSGVNWKRINRFPPRTFFVLTEELKKRGKTAPASLWGFEEPQ